MRIWRKTDIKMRGGLDDTIDKIPGVTTASGSITGSTIPSLRQSLSSRRWRQAESAAPIREFLLHRPGTLATKRSLLGWRVRRVRLAVEDALLLPSAIAVPTPVGV
jgi:hypothetical protein